MTEWDLTGDYDPPLPRVFPLERFDRDVIWPPPAADPADEPVEPWARRGHIWDER